jgi:hypothetical protein
MRLLTESVLPCFRWEKEGVRAGERPWGVLMFLFPAVSTAWPPLIMASSTLHPSDPTPTTLRLALVSATRTEEMSEGARCWLDRRIVQLEPYRSDSSVCFVALCISEATEPQCSAPQLFYGVRKPASGHDPQSHPPPIHQLSS